MLIKQAEDLIKKGAIDSLKELLAENLSIIAAENASKDLLNIAAVEGQYDIFKFMLDQYKFDMCTSTFSLTIVVAVTNNHLEFLKSFKKDNPDFDFKTVIHQANGFHLTHFAAIYGHYSTFEWLVDEQGLDPHATAKNGEIPLMDAAKMGHLQFLKDFKTKNPDFDFKTVIHQENGFHLTHFAAIYGHYSTFEWLVDEQGLDPHATAKNGDIPLMDAAKMGHLQFLKDFKTKNPDFDFKTVIHQAARVHLTHFAAIYGHYSTFEWLVDEQGLDPHATAKNGKIPLMDAAKMGRLQFLKDFKTKNPDFDFKTVIRQENGFHLTHFAAIYGHYSTFEWLVDEQGLDPHATAKNGEIPLIYAAQMGHLQFLKDFKAKNPDFDFKTVIHQENGFHLTHFAAIYGHYSTFEWLVDEQGLDPHATAKNGEIPLMDAAKMGHLQFLKDFKTKNPDFDFKTVIRQENGFHLTHFAAIYGHYSTFEWLVDEQGLDPHATAKNGEIPLIYAAHMGHLQFLKDFKAKNPDFDFKTVIHQANGFHLTHFAAIYGHYSTFEWLVDEQGLDPHATAKNGEIPLMDAAKMGRLQFLKDFKTKNPDFDFKTVIRQENGFHLTHFAAIYGHYSTFEWLVDEQGLDPHAVIINGNTSSLMLAQSNNHVQFVTRYKVAELAAKIFNDKIINVENDLKEYQNNPELSTLLVAMITNLCKKHGIPTHINRERYLPDFITKGIELQKTTKETLTYILNPLVSLLCYKLDQAKFPCIMHYSYIYNKVITDYPNLIEQSDIISTNEEAPYSNTISKLEQHYRKFNKEEKDRVITVLSYEKEPYYKPANFFQHLINVKLEKKILKMLICYSKTADLIFTALQDIVIDSQDFAKFKHLEAKYKNPDPAILKKIIADQHTTLIDQNETLKIYKEKTDKMEAELSKPSFQRDEELKKRQMISEGAKNKKLTDYWSKKVNPRKRVREDGENENILDQNKVMALK